MSNTLPLNSLVTISGTLTNNSYYTIPSGIVTNSVRTNTPIEKKIVRCVNCKGVDIIPEWVVRHNKEIIKEQSMEEYGFEQLEKKKVSSTTWGSTSGTLSFVLDTIENYIQLKLICKNCGYTVIIDIDKFLVVDKL